MFKLPFTDKLEKRNEKNIVSWLENQYDTADAVRRVRESEWYTNILFLAGNQWESAAADVRRFRKVQIYPPNTKVKIVNNVLYSLARQAAAALRDNLSQQIAVAATSDESDLMAAELATEFLHSRFYEDKEYEIRFHEILWCMCCGVVARKTFYEPNKPGLTPAGKMENIGDIETEVVNPWRFYLSPWIDSFGSIPYVIEADVRDIDEINDLYPGHDVQAEEVAEGVQFIDKLLTNVVTQSEPSYNTPRRKNAAILKRLYAAPTYKNPDGKLFVWANGKLLQEDILPDRQMPYVVMHWFPIPGMIYSLPFISPLRDMQREINITLSQLIELKNRQLRGDIVVQGTEPPTNSIDPETGRRTVLVPLASQKWEFIRYDMKASEAEMLLVRMWNEMMQVAGIHESSIGQTPPREVTATQIMALKESDLAGLTMFRSGFDYSHSQIARQKLQIAKLHYVIPRMIRILGENQSVNAKAFFGSDFRNTEDVRPRSIPMMSAASAMQMKRDMALSGLFGPYNGPDDMLAKVTALLSSGLPKIEDEVRELIKPYSLGELRAIVAQLNAKKAELAAVALDMQMQQAVMQMQSMMQPPAEPEVEVEPTTADMMHASQMEIAAKEAELRRMKEVGNAETETGREAR